MLKCKLTCKACGKADVEFEVPYRQSEHHDLIEWMETVVRPAMGRAHQQVSPLCMGPHCDLMVPISDAAPGVGCRPKLDS